MGGFGLYGWREFKGILIEGNFTWIIVFCEFFSQKKMQKLESSLQDNARSSYISLPNYGLKLKLFTRFY